MLPVMTMRRRYREGVTGYGLLVWLAVLAAGTAASVLFDVGGWPVLAALLLGALVIRADECLRPGTGRRRKADALVCDCHGLDLLLAPDWQVLAMHPLPVPDAFVRWSGPGGSVDLSTPPPADADEWERNPIAIRTHASFDTLATRPAGPPVRDDTPLSGKMRA